MKATDEQVIEAWGRNHADRKVTALELGMHPNNLDMRLMRLRLKGHVLPEAKRGFAINRELARTAGRKGGKHVKTKKNASSGVPIPRQSV